MMKENSGGRVWLGISYTAPAKPSKARVYIWRKLKELGAEVSVLEIRFVDPRDEEKVVALFRRRAENDFRELFLDFARLYEELAPPLDEQEKQRRILRRRYCKLKNRDFFDVERELSELDFAGGFAELMDDIQLSTGDLYRQFIALFSEK